MSSTSDNRYGFHNVTAAKAGVSPEFVHVNVIQPMDSLTSKIQKALSLKPDDPAYKAAEKICHNGSEAIESILNGTFLQKAFGADALVDAETSSEVSNNNSFLMNR